MTRPGFAFEIAARDGEARTGRLHTPHGVIDTPAFMPVATFGAVRGVSNRELRELGAQILLANTYHLHERPGEASIAALGGLHGFSGWTGPWLTDSGGFQVTSLADRVRVDEDGVVFRSPLDGARRQLTPERAVEIQQQLGPDIAMVLDECRPIANDSRPDAQAARESMERTLRWAERSRRAHTRADQALFGIVQGGASAALRRHSARATVEIGFDGYAHGGLGLGEDRDQRQELIAAGSESLPDDRPRYLMGLGRPEDLVDAIACGVELFDCVVPTRNGRHGVLFTSQGVLNLRNRRFREDGAPPDPACDCSTCGGHSRAYLSHLLRSGEALGSRLASVHNLRFYHALLEQARDAIAAGRFAALRKQVVEDARTRP